MAVLDGRRIVPSFYLDQSLFLGSVFVIAVMNRGMGQDIVRELLMKLGSSVLHGLLRIQYKRQRFIFHFNQAHSLNCGDLVFRNDSRHIIAVVAHMADKKVPVGNILMRRIQGIRMSGSRERIIRHVEACNDLNDSWDLLRFRNID